MSNFELVMCVRDSHGHPTGKTKKYVTDSAYKLWEFFVRNSPPLKQTKNKTSVSALPDGQEAQTILSNLYSQKN